VVIGYGKTTCVQACALGHHGLFFSTFANAVIAAARWPPFPSGGTGQQRATESDCLARGPTCTSPIPLDRID
jgi:hypothetical protein